MQRLLTLIHALGMMLVMFSITYILPIFTSYIYHDGTLIDFALAMVMTLAVGSLMWLLTRHNKGELYPARLFPSSDDVDGDACFCHDAVIATDQWFVFHRCLF